MQEYKYLTTANVIFNHDLTKVALIHRPPHKAFPNTLALPGGKLLENENFKNAAIRETVEEINYKPLDVYFSNIYEAQGYFMTCYFCKVESDSDIDEQYWFSLQKFYSLKLAPNVSKACEDAYDKALLNFKSDTFSKVDEVIRLSTKYVYDHPIEIAEEWGWDHHLLNRRIGIIGTAVGSIILHIGGYKPDNLLVQSSLDKLITMVNDDGGWSTKSLAGPSILESTYYCIKALYLHNYAENVLEKAVAWVSAQQNPDGGWGSKYGKKSRLLTTIFALEILGWFNLSNEQTMGLNWLLSNQNDDGSWGEDYRMSVGTASHTARAIIHLINSNQATTSPEIIKARSWLLDEYSKRQEWTDSTEMEYINIKENDSRRIMFTHSVYPLAIQAQILCGTPISDKIVIKELFKMINEGYEQHYWKHRIATKHIPIWNTLEHLNLLLQIKRSAITIITRLLSQVPSGNSDVKHFNFLFNTALSNKNIFKKEKAEEENVTLPNQDNANTKIKKNIQKLVSENQVERAVEILLDHFTNSTSNKEEQNNLIMLSGKLASIQSQQRSGFPMNDINKQLTQLKLTLLTIIDHSL